MSTAVRLPGAEIVEVGIEHLSHGVISVEALAVLAAAPRLRRDGIAVPSGFDEAGAHLELYDRLGAQLGDGAHSRHHAMMRRVLSYAVSFRAPGHRP